MSFDTDAAKADLAARVSVLRAAGDRRWLHVNSVLHGVDIEERFYRSLLNECGVEQADIDTAVAKISGAP